MYLYKCISVHVFMIVCIIYVLFMTCHECIIINISDFGTKSSIRRKFHNQNKIFTYEIVKMKRNSVYSGCVLLVSLNYAFCRHIIRLTDKIESIPRTFKRMSFCTRKMSVFITWREIVLINATLKVRKVSEKTWKDILIRSTQASPESFP